jgi:hypothetical protein
MHYHVLCIKVDGLYPSGIIHYRVAKILLDLIFGMKKENRMQVMETIMGRIRVEDRVRVGKLILLWRRKVHEDDVSTILTHVKVCSPHCSVEPD